MFVSIGLRMKVEVEALNMVEPLGAYMKHRTVPLIKRVERGQERIGYRIVMAPAISGQSINNGYSRTLVDLARAKNLPVCDECKNYPARGGFTKRTTDNQLSFDKRVETCVVEDLTGFLAPNAGVRRTSPVMFSNMVPDIEHGKAMLDSQFHVRYNFESNKHDPFNVEIGSAVYMLSIAMNVDDIGRLSNGGYVSDRIERVKLAFKGLTALIEGLGFGAKKARYLPVYEVLSGVAAISSPLPFMVSKPKLYYGDKCYIEDTIERAQRYVRALRDFGEQVKIFYFDREGAIRGSVQIQQGVKRLGSYTELIEELLSEVVNYISQQQQRRTS
ncbi:MAG: DevR family CRISPR-associated autoregulator [Acidilobaceae archaeon]